jgi:hypothetical protein
VNVLQQKLTDAKVKFTTKDKKPTLFTLARDNGLLDEDVDKENATPVVNAVVVASHSSNSSSTASNSSDANKRDSNHSNSSGDSTSTASNSSDANKRDSNNSYSSVDSTSTASNSSYANKRDSNNSYSSGDSTAVASNSSGELPNERHPHSSNSSSTASNSSDANKRDSNHSNSSGDSTSAASNSSGELPYLAQLFSTRNRLRAEKRENTMLRAKEEIESDRQLLDCNRKFLGSFDKDGNWEMGKVEKRLRECGAKATNEHSRSRLRDELFKVRDLVMNHRVALKRESWTQSSRFSPTIQVRVLQTIMRK